jgi:hypothetical protein
LRIIFADRSEIEAEPTLARALADRLWEGAHSRRGWASAAAAIQQALSRGAANKVELDQRESTATAEALDLIRQANSNNGTAS